MAVVISVDSAARRVEPEGRTPLELVVRDSHPRVHNKTEMNGSKFKSMIDMSNQGGELVRKYRREGEQRGQTSTHTTTFVPSPSLYVYWSLRGSLVWLTRSMPQLGTWL